MIEKVHVQNFRCLRDVALRLGPLTALVGPNASGKTALLDVLDPWRPLTHGDVWRDARGGRVSFRVTRDGDNAHTQWFPGTYLAQQAAVYSWKYQVLQLLPMNLRSPNRLESQTSLSRWGDNLTSVFATLGRRRQAEVGRALAALVPSIGDVEVRPHQTERDFLQLRFEDRWQTDLWYTPAQVSDGTMLVLAFLVLQYQDPPVDLLCIDDPEHGLHPYLLREVVGLLRKMAHGEIGPRPVQVILATHSAALLDCLEPEEVRFLSRDPADGSTVIHEAPTGTPDWKSAFDEYQQSMGAMWLSGSLGGVPGV